MSHQVLIPLAGMFMIVTLSLGVPLVRAFSRRWEREQSLPPSAGDREQLARIEQAIEAMAIEVERISESQRFTTKLLSDRAGGLPAGRQ